MDLFGCIINPLIYPAVTSQLVNEFINIHKVNRFRPSRLSWHGSIVFSTNKLGPKREGVEDKDLMVVPQSQRPEELSEEPSFFQEIGCARNDWCQKVRW